MNNSKVFNCPLCKSKYSTTSKVPLTLPCGHVICKECLHQTASFSKDFKCPLDKIDIVKDISTLPVCRTILQYLPTKEKKQKLFICSCGSQKSIKYSCACDNDYFCSRCLQNHSSSGHEIFYFSPEKNNILSEVEMINTHASEKYKEIQEKLNNLSDIKIRLIDQTKNEIQKLNEEFTALTQNILNYKLSLEEKIKDFYNTQSQQIEKQKEIISKQNNLIASLTNNIRSFTKKISESSPLVYLEVMNEKSRLFSQWEHILKIPASTTLLMKANFKLPLIRYYSKSSYSDLMHKIASINFKPIKEGLAFSPDQDQSHNCQSDSTKDNTRNSHQSENAQLKMSKPRKNSDPSQGASKSKMFNLDKKEIYKPVLINDQSSYKYVVNNLKGEENCRIALRNDKVNGNSCKVGAKSFSRKKEQQLCISD